MTNFSLFPPIMNSTRKTNQKHTRLNKIKVALVSKHNQ